jgi:ceramide glucosyltransferase
MPFGLLGWLAAWKLGMPALGIGLFAAAFLNRMIQSLAVGWGIVRDKQALWLAWLYPLRDLLGFFVWLGSYTSRRFLWRGETYYFGQEGKIFPLERHAAPVRE